ncbi:DNA protecting protein DprA [Candidatus Koribacter versatilis Ellin345]|uniref:DNA protecting protein DprA n=1 Tax=Koribacter versatilis (strain Ellin345) TaxID=204669 RepID=Q1ILA8_KORVE|nr:DNA-processing protein DprA [Candidatus Koribacter versatilis]ABF42342.1 DNA protecting protein DprA [Candidatus Koribacter versatilis Ellin345]
MTVVEPTTSNRQRQWLALSLTPQLGPTRGRRLVEHFGDVERIFRASLTELEASGLPAASAQSIALGKSYELAEDEMVKTAQAGAKIVAIGDPEYPPRLMEIYDPPLALRVRGDVSILSKPGMAVVGTRHPTPYGLGMAERLSCDLAARGVIILSGLARGVDTAAHRGTINARGKTVAVFGTGVDEIYPRANKKLAEQIVEFGGALISEFPTGTFPAPQNFPIRNRIISGLSVGVLVIEAGEYSGTRITARCALEQCREVFAVPGNVTNKLSWGPNTLIKQGAKLVATWEDVWEELGSDIRLQIPPPEALATETPQAASLFDQHEMPAQERKVYALLRADESMHIDELIEKLDGRLSSAEIFSALFELEMASKIRQMPGKYYVRSM